MIPMNRERTLAREISATQIPSGDRQALAAGTKIQIHQTLGGSYTVQTDFGLFRIDGKDGDALGAVSYTHLDVYKRQVLNRLESEELQAALRSLVRNRFGR